MTRNIKIYLLCETILAAFGGFILPIYVLYFRYFGATIFQVALLAAVFEASVLLFEIPTGLFADKFGRRLSVILGFAVFAVSGFFFIRAPHFTGFLVAEILFGLAEAFISGAAEALAVDSITAEDKLPALKRLYTRRSRLRIAVTSLCMLAAGYAFARSAEVTFYPLLIGGLAGFVASFFFVTAGRADGEKPRLFEPLKAMFAQVKRLPILRMIFIVAIVSEFAYEGADQYWQVWGGEVQDIAVTWFGWMTAAGAVLAFALVGPVVKRFSGNITMPLLILLVAGVAISSVPNVPVAVLPAVLIMYFISKELARPLFSTAINAVVASEGRATFLSGYNLTCSIGEVASGVLVGVIASRLGIPVVFVLCGGALVIFIIAALFRMTLGGPAPATKQ